MLVEHTDCTRLNSLLQLSAVVVGRGGQLLHLRILLHRGFIDDDLAYRLSGYLLLGGSFGCCSGLGLLGGRFRC